MPVEISEQDPLEYVRMRMKDMTVAQQTRIALDAGVSHKTVKNILAGVRDVRYGNVKNLQRALLATEAAKP